MPKKLLLIPFCAVCLLCCSWGFFSHKRISRLAVFTLPSAMAKFYKSNIDYLTEHAVDPDRRRNADSLEAPRHYLDADHFGESPFDSIPVQWDLAVKKYSEKTLNDFGTVPWTIDRNYRMLVKAFRDRDSSAILHYSSDLSHYIADAHVPLHTTENYNGQLSGQTGIHSFWESRLPELFADRYNYFVGKPRYISDPLKEAWKIVKNTFKYKDSVLLIEARLTKSFPADQKFTYTQRNGRTEKQYSEDFAKAYHDAMNGMVEQQMRSSILSVGSFWYSAWVDAGQPNLTKLAKPSDSDLRNKNLEKEEKLYKQGKLIDREL